MYGYESETYQPTFQVKFNRNFVKDLHKLDAATIQLVVDKYMFVIARGQLNGKSFIQNCRKYSEDSYEFYTPVADTDLILTWRLFADLQIESVDDKHREMVLMYTLSFDAVCTYEYQSHYIIHNINFLLEEMLQKYMPGTKEVYSTDRISKPPLPQGHQRYPRTFRYGVP